MQNLTFSLWNSLQNERNYMFISIDIGKKAFDKIQHIYMIKYLSKLRTFLI